MKIGIPQNLKTEEHPFRQIAVTSFIKGSFSILLGIILLLSVKSDFKDGHIFLTSEKMIIALGLIAIGSKSLWKGYQNEFPFSLQEMYQPSKGANVNNLLAQRNQGHTLLANQYANMIHTKSFSLMKEEKGAIKDWQILFYKLVSKKGISKIFDYVPYPISNFIANQSSPVALLGFFVLLMATFLFISYLEVLPIDMIWINLFILIGLLSWWRPTRIDLVLEINFKKNLSNNVLFFIVFYIVTIFLYKPYAEEVNFSLLFSILVIASVIVYTAFLSFKLIETVFAKRELVNIEISSNNLMTHRVSTQPNNILQQFDNILKQSTGWFFKNLTRDGRGLLAGDQHKKGDFDLEYVYETQPVIISTKYDSFSENQLSKIWKIGTFITSIGIFLFFLGSLFLPAIDTNFMKQNLEQALLAYSPKMLMSLYFILFGLALSFFGNKLIYEIYMFFNTEIFFESKLILFHAHGNYDEFEHITGGIKRKDTFTDFTPEIKVCRIISSVFVHPYLEKGDLEKRNRFLISVHQDEEMLHTLLNEFKKNMLPYKMTIESSDMSAKIIEDQDKKRLE